MSDIKRMIQDVRPPLQRIAPLTYWICWGYVVVNFLLGFTMIFIYKYTQPIAVTSILPYWFWGVVFLILGVLTLYGLLRNNWRLTREVQLASVGVKTIWAIALIIQTVHTPAVLGVTSVWLFLAYIQSITYIFFIPGISNVHLR